MRQVPNYLIVGNGQMASHMVHYFRCLSIPYQQWYRSQHDSATLHRLIQQATHILLLINDDAIEDFIIEHLHTLTHTEIIHFSASLNTTLAYSTHPLCTFTGTTPYSLEDYQRIPFIMDKETPPFSQLLPELNNPCYQIALSEKAYYHAMCVIANNFTTLLWEKFFREMSERFSMDKDHLIPFLEKTFDNLSRYPAMKLTGPLARGDAKSLKRDLDSLTEDSFYSIFKSFMTTYEGTNDE